MLENKSYCDVSYILLFSVSRICSIKLQYGTNSCAVSVSLPVSICPHAAILNLLHAFLLELLLDSYMKFVDKCTFGQSHNSNGHVIGRQTCVCMPLECNLSIICIQERDVFQTKVIDRDESSILYLVHFCKIFRGFEVIKE
jgi:hypothetical protein